MLCGVSPVSLAFEVKSQNVFTHDAILALAITNQNPRPPYTLLAAGKTDTQRHLCGFHRMPGRSFLCPGGPLGHAPSLWSNRPLPLAGSGSRCSVTIATRISVRVDAAAPYSDHGLKLALLLPGLLGTMRELERGGCLTYSIVVATKARLL